MKVSFLIFAVIIFSMVLVGSNIMLGNIVDSYQPVTGVSYPNTTFFAGYEKYTERAENVTESVWNDSENSVNNPNIADQFGFLASASRTVRGVKSSVSDSKTIIDQAGSQMGIPKEILKLGGFIIVLLFVFAVASAIFKWDL